MDPRLQELADDIIALKSKAARHVSGEFSRTIILVDEKLDEILELVAAHLQAYLVQHAGVPVLGGKLPEAQQAIVADEAVDYGDVQVAHPRAVKIYGSDAG